MRIVVNGRDISSKVSTVSWSGDNSNVARKLDLSLTSDTKLACGNQVLFSDGGKELFRGYVFTRELEQASGVLMVTAYDGLIYLMKSSGTMNSKNITPEDITGRIAKDFNIPIGKLASTGIKIKQLYNNKSLYQIIMGAYTKAHKQTGKKYIVVMNEGKLSVVVRGANIIHYASRFVTGTNNSESIENVVNRVRIYDTKGEYIGKVEDGTLVQLYGILQQVYTKEDRVNATTAGRAMLKGIEKTVSMDGIGDSSCITGNAITLGITDGISGLFYIDGDNHTWQNGIHTMSLTLNYSNLMDEQTEE